MPISGQLTLTFAPDSGPDDPAVQFSSGGRMVSLSIPAGATVATFPVPNLGLQTGTVAGLITLTATLRAGGSDITPSPAPVRTVRVNRAGPVISTVRITRTATGFEVAITGFSTPREVTQVMFHFNAAAGATLQTADVTVPVESLFSAWFGSAASAQYGGQFTFTQPFTLQGTAGGIASVAVTLANRVGNSNTVTATMP